MRITYVDLKALLGRNEQIIKYVIGIVTGVLVGILITQGSNIVFQPNIEYEECPKYIVNTSLMKSVHCILLKNTGYAPSDNVKLTIETDFFQQYNTIEPEEIICDGCMKVNGNKTIYSFDKFAKGAIAWIYIPAPSENAKIGISGIYNGGIPIKKGTSTTPNILMNQLIIGVLFLISYVLGLLSYCILSKNRAIQKETIEESNKKEEHEKL